MSIDGFTRAEIDRRLQTPGMMSRGEQQQQSG
jgi:hypothetical protein